MSATPLRVFLVEDSAVIRTELALTLQEVCGARVVGAVGTQREAIERLTDDALACDVVIVDVVLADGTGFEVLAEPRVRRAGRRFAVLTNYASDAVRRRCAELSVERVFDKSNEIDELLDYCGEVSG